MKSTHPAGARACACACVCVCLSKTGGGRTQSPRKLHAAQSPPGQAVKVNSHEELACRLREGLSLWEFFFPTGDKNHPRVQSGDRIITRNGAVKVFFQSKIKLSLRAKVVVKISYKIQNGPKFCCFSFF